MREIVYIEFDLSNVAIQQLQRGFCPHQLVLLQLSLSYERNRWASPDTQTKLGVFFIFVLIFTVFFTILPSQSRYPQRAILVSGCTNGSRTAGMCFLDVWQQLLSWQPLH